MPAKKNPDPPYEEPNPELGSAREAAEAAATPKSATAKATDTTNDTKESE